MLTPERQSAQMSKIKNGGLDQYDTEPFELQQFGTAGVEGVKTAVAQYDTDNPRQQTCNGSWTADKLISGKYLHSPPLFVTSSYFKHSFTLGCRH